MAQIAVPTEIHNALERGAALAISISGGKDGQAMLNALMGFWYTHDFPGEVFVIHADLGVMEWPQTSGHVRKLARQAGIPLAVVRRPQGDLLDRWQERMEKLKGTGKPFWSSAANRYCTSDLKRGPINKHLRQYPLVISAEGIRAQESKTRAKKPVWEVRSAITTKSREAYTWNPIHHWTLEDVWKACGTSSDDLKRRQQLYREGHIHEALFGWPCHPAYVYGNQRLSCSLCVLASPNDLANGAKHNPEIFQTLVKMETESGCSFRHNFWLRDLKIA